MRGSRQFLQLIVCLALNSCVASAQGDTAVDVHLRFALTGPKTHHPLPAAVIWLVPMRQTPPAPFVPDRHYRLVQKNREFKPHLLVIPVGSIVDFPNKDPFFHNVFSLFDGKRFDLGLYEAGAIKSVTFSREGVSYIFCNIHPEMSAVILTLSTSLFSIADSEGSFRIAQVPAGDYEMHVWIEGFTQPSLNTMDRRVHITQNSGDLGVVDVPATPQKAAPHTNMYGQPYDRETKPAY